MDETINYFLIKHQRDAKYLSYEQNTGDTKYEELDKNDVQPQFKFKVDSHDNKENNTPYWTDNSRMNEKQKKGYVIYPESNNKVYLTLWNNYITIQPKLLLRFDRQIFYDSK
jgi:hypothetical protein